MQCLSAEAAATARQHVTPDGRETVCFVCAISRRPEEAVLIGPGLAERLADLQPSVASAEQARVLASLERATLCACDIATLLDTPQADVEDHLRDLAARGLVEPAQADGMPTYALADPGHQALATLTHMPSNGSRGPAAAERTATTTLQLAPEECASCAGSLPGTLSVVDGVQDVRVDTVTGQVRVEHAPGVTREDLEAAVTAGGIRLAAEREERGDGEAPWWRRPRSVALAIAAVLTALGLLFDFVLGVEPVAIALFLAAVPIGGYFPAGAGLRALRRGRVTINTLLVGALAGALALGLFEEAAILVVVFSLGEVLEEYAADKARGSLRALLELAPQEARVLRDGTHQMVPVDTLIPGERVLVLPGEKLPTDGRVVDGSSAVDQSPVTGESVPVEVTPCSEVFGATLNGDGALEIEVTKRYEDTTLARVIHQVREAQAHKAPSERFAERFGAIYTPAMFALATALAVLPALLFDADLRTWFERGLVVLVVSCSCALVLSVPVAIVSAITRAARAGILVKGGLYLEALGRIHVVAFDKTGTLTQGRPEVVDVVALDGMTNRDLLALAAAVESRSDHPLAQAIVRRAAEQDVMVPEVSDARTLTGIGAEARLDGHVYRVGRARLFERDGDSGKWSHVLDAQQAHGRTAVLVGSDRGVAGVIALADEVRPQAADTVARLRELGVRHVLMLTGDNEPTARAIAEQVGIDDFRAGLLPEDKTAAVRELRERYGPIAMVGDGINDAPAMAQADIGIAMGAAGSDVALETADLALMADDLRRLPDAIGLSRRALANIRQNIAMSLAVIVALVLAAFVGWINLVSGLILNEAAALLIIANGLRLLRWNAASDTEHRSGGDVQVVEAGA